MSNINGEEMKRLSRVLLTITGLFSIVYADTSAETTIAKALPAVVNIFAEQVIERSPFADFFGDPLLEFFGEGRRKEIAQSLGTGVIVKPEGVVVTCYHVVRNARTIKIKLSDGTEFEANVVSTDEINDLAALQLKGKVTKGFPVLKLGNSDQLKTGYKVYAIGNAFGLGHIVTDGIISNPSLKIGEKRFIVTNAAINPGNSGGALIDAATGELLAIPNAIVSRTGASHGVGFAIPVNLVRGVLETVGKGEQVVRPWPGVVVQDLTPDMVHDLGISYKKGIIVQRLHPLSPLKELEPGDMIVALNGKEVQDTADFRQQFQTLEMGSSGLLTVIKGDQEKEIHFIASAPPKNPTEKPVTIKSGLLKGVIVSNLSPALAVQLNLDESQTGVVVVNGSASHGWMLLQKGDMILSLNDKKIESVQDLLDQMKSSSRGFSLVLKRGSQIMTLQRR